MVKGVPLYRLEKELALLGCPITRSQMAGWIVQYGAGYFQPLVDHMDCVMLERRVNMVDETHDLLLKGTVKNAYIWLRTTSPFDPEPPLAIYGLGPGRDTDVLRRYYDGWEGTIESDGFVDYFTFTAESEENPYTNITHALCWDHVRRPFRKALALVEASGMSEKDQNGTLEKFIMRSIGAIYHKYEPLELVSPEERLAACQKDIAPMVNDFFTLLESLDLEQMRKPPELDYENALDEEGNLKKPDTSMKVPVVWKDGKNPTGKKLHLGVFPMSDTLFKGINFAIDPVHKECLKVFLNDPMVPMSNAIAERQIKPYAIGRKNWLFNITDRGATAACNEYTLCQSAILNKRDPYIFHLYLMQEYLPLVERIPIKKDGKVVNYEYRIRDYSKLPDMLPSSEAYGAWEEAFKKEFLDTPIPGSQTTPPEAPIRQLRRERAAQRQAEKAQA